MNAPSDPIGDSGSFIPDVPAELERQVTRAGRAMARVYAARRRLEEHHGPAEAVRKLVEAGSSSAASVDSAVERLARVIASAPEHPGASELVLATMRAVDGMEASAEVVERAVAALSQGSSGHRGLASRLPSSSWT